MDNKKQLDELFANFDHTDFGTIDDWYMAIDEAWPTISARLEAADKLAEAVNRTYDMQGWGNTKNREIEAALAEYQKIVEDN